MKSPALVFPFAFLLTRGTPVAVVRGNARRLSGIGPL